MGRIREGRQLGLVALEGERGSQFVRVEVDLIDRRIAEVGPVAFVVYLLLRRSVRALPRSAHREADRARIEAGEKFAVAKIADIAARAGVGTATVHRAIARLAARGWIAIERPDRRFENLYLLGDAAGWLVDRAVGEIETIDRGEPGELSKRPGPIYQNDLSGGVKTIAPLNRDQIEIRSRSDRADAPAEIAQAEIPFAEAEPRDRKSICGWEGSIAPSAPRRGRVPDELVEDPEKPGRTIRARECAALLSARTKRRDLADADGEAEYTGAEAVALWRSMFFAYFDFEDPATATASTFGEAAKTYEKRVAARHWGDGRSSPVFAYLRASARLWRDKKPKDTFPSSPAPVLLALLRDDRARGPSPLWTQWLAKRARR